MLYDYIVNESDKCIYNKYRNIICTIIFLYEDDLLISGLKIHVMNYVKSLFINNIDKKNLDQVEVILGFKITRSEKENFSDESHKVENFLRKYNYLNVNLQAHPMIQI
jgi:hypothetical protein